MSYRNTTDLRQDINQTAPQEPIPAGNQVIPALADTGEKIIQMDQEAKMTANYSKAVSDINTLSMQYKIDNQDDPLGGLQKLQSDRQKILDNYGQQISPLFRRDWNDQTRNMGELDDMRTKTWAFDQMKQNTVKNINDSIKTNLNQAAIDGQQFGGDDKAELGSLLNYGMNKQKLVNFGNQHLGAEDTGTLLQSYDGDYSKSFISGVAQVNPLKALTLMDRPDVQESFHDKGQFLEMQKAVQSRALNMGKVNADNEVLGTLKDENNILTKSVNGQPMSYGQLQQAFDASPNMSDEAKNWFMKANGFANSEGKLDDATKLQNKAQIFDNMTQLATKKDLSSQDMATFQKQVYSGLNNGSIDQKEATTYLNGVLSPLVTQKETNNSQFSFNHWTSPNVGFDGIKELFDKNVAIGPAAGETKVGPVTEALNNENKVKLYDNYMSSLQQTASSYGVSMDKISTLNDTQKSKLYTDAQAQAWKAYQLDKNPVLGTLPDLPNQTLTGGKLIQGMAGDRSLKPDATAKPTFDMHIGSDGNLYRVYPDGTKENIGPAPDGVKF